MSQRNLFELRKNPRQRLHSQRALEVTVEVERALEEKSEKTSSFHRRKEAQRDLLRLKEDLQGDKSSLPLLHYAVANGTLSVVSYLLRAWQSRLATCTAEDNETVLHIAAERNLPGMAALLLLSEVVDDDRALALAEKIEASVCSTEAIEHWSKELRELQKDSNHFDGQLGSQLLLTRAHSNHHTPISSAALRGSEKTLQLMLDWAMTFGLNCHKSWPDVIYCADKSGSSLLHLAVESRNVKAVQCLCRICDVTRKSAGGDAAVHLAADCGSVEILTVLENSNPAVLGQRDKKGRSLMHRASKANKATLIAFLLTKEVDINDKDELGNTPLMLAARYDSSEAIDAIMKSPHVDLEITNNSGCTIVHSAVGNFQALESLLEYDTKLIGVLNKGDQNGHTPLHSASMGGYHKDIVRLLERGANPNSKSISKETPLHLAAENGWLRSSRRLMERCDVNAIDCEGQTALHKAAASGSYPIARALIHKGAKFYKDIRDRTPLHYAAASGDVETCRALVDSGAPIGNINLEDSNGDTPLHLAVEGNRADTVAFLLRRLKHARNGFPPEDQIGKLNKSQRNALDVALQRGNSDAAAEFANSELWSVFLRDTGKTEDRQIQLMVEKMPAVAMKFLNRCYTKKDRFIESYDFRLLQGNATTNRSSIQSLKTMCDLEATECLSHPVCTAILNHKWVNFGLWFTLPAALFFVAYVVLLSVYVTEMHPSHRENQTESSWGHVTAMRWSLIVLASILGLLLLSWLVSTIVQTSVKRKPQSIWSLFRSFFALRLLLVITTLLFLIPINEPDDNPNWVAGAVAVFCGWLNFVLLLRRVPYFGLFVVMIYKMFKRLLQVSLLILLFTFAFAFSFYALTAEQNVYPSFKETPLAFLRVFSIMAGELEFFNVFLPTDAKGKDVPLQNYAWLALLYVFCVLIMAVLVQNLLIGLAVGDIDYIRKRATLKSYIMQIEDYIAIQEKTPEWLRRRYEKEPSSLEQKSTSWNSRFWKRLEVSDLRDEARGELRAEDAENRTELRKLLKMQQAKIDQMADTIEWMKEKMIKQRETRGSLHDTSVLLSTRDRESISATESMKRTVSESIFDETDKARLRVPIKEEPDAN